MNVNDWQRMSWHAREKYLRRMRPRPVVSDIEPVVVRDSVHVPEPVKPSKPAPFRNDAIVSRCGSCGSWMIDTCNTKHGDRYAC